MDCIHVKARDNHTVISKSVYLAIAVNMDGKKEVTADLKKIYTANIKIIDKAE